MLASIALVGCTSDDLIENGGLEDQKKPQAELVRGDAYVNFVINTKTDSSRGVTGSETDTSGDTHENADDNNHHVAGKEAENAVNKLLLVIAKAVDGTSKTEPELYTEVMTEGSKNVQNGYVGYLSGNQLTTTDGVISLATPIRLDYTGDYAVLAVINPAPGLEALIKEGSDHKAAYEAILSYKGNDAYTKNTNDNGGTNFQMSNKEACVITATPAHNIPTNPVKATIAVERTVSKATWRWVAKQTTLPGEILPTKENVYSVDVAVKKQAPEQGSFWYKKAETGYDTYFYSEEFNKAISSNGNTYWVLFKDNSSDNTDAQGKIITSEVEAIFLASETYATYVGVIDDTDNKNDDDEDNTQSVTGREITDDLLSEDYAQAVANVTDALVQSLTFVYSSTATETSKYYVHLTHYALTNLTQKVNAVRHIDNGTKTRQMGILATGEYLSTPYYADINSDKAVTFDNSLATVESAAAAFTSGVTGNVFQALPTSETEGTADTPHYTGEGESNDVGGFMQYLYENSCKAEKVKASTVTGIVLAGEIYDETGAKVPVLYKYNQKYYRTLQALVDELGTDGVFTITKGEGESATTHKITANTTDDAASAAGIDVYKDGRCYYYSAQIKHFDDGIADNIGVMEYAIMRNNIYSLAVKSIKEIGDARVDVTENTPISDIRSYVQLEVSILPWIVRFNDLEL